MRVSLFIAAVTFGIFAAPARAAENASAQPTPDEQEIVRLTNEQRQQRGLGPLSVDSHLTAAAHKHSQNMARARVLAHTLDGGTMTNRIRESGYKFLAIGENVAFNDPTPKAAVDAWMNSPGHRANILNKNFTEIGVGIALDDDGEPYYTQDFGRPLSAGPTESATFSITNETQEPATIVLPGNTNATRLDAGSSGSFTVSGTGELPNIEVRAGNDKASLKFENGGAYRIVRVGEELKVESEK